MIYTMLTKSKILFLALFFLSHLTIAQVRVVTELSENWRFSKGSFSDAHQKAFNDSKWEKVTVPHDWAIYGPFDKEIDKQMVAIVQNGEKVPTEKTGRTGSLPYIGEGWYRNTF